MLSGGNSCGGSENNAVANSSNIGILAPFSTANLRQLTSNSQVINSQFQPQQHSYQNINLQLAAAAAASHEALVAFGGTGNMLATVPNQFNQSGIGNQIQKIIPAKPPTVTGVVNGVMNGAIKQQTSSTTKVNKIRQSTEGEYQVGCFYIYIKNC